MLIRESESKMISRLFLFEFFQGAAIALYFIAAISIFVERLPALELPKVFILSAFLLWIFGFLYSRIEHHFPTRILIYIVLLFNASFIILFRLFIHWQNETWFLFIFLAAFNVFYLLNNLEFWGLVSLLYDVRQSKRLFAIVSAWDGPARLAGYAIAFAFASVIGTENLLWISATFMLVSIILFFPLAESKEMRDLAPKHHHHYATHHVQHIHSAVTGNKLVSNAALVSFLSFCFYLIANFVLYGYIKREFHSDFALARFFAIFLVIIRGFTLIIKPLFINRLLDRMGLRKSLLIAPIFLALFSFVSFLATGGDNSKPGFYLFMIMAILVDILRSAIQSPVLLATLQPLPSTQRLRGHTIIKGLMDPFAFLTVGILLLLVGSHEGEANLETLSALLIFISALWAYFSFSVDNNYMEALTEAFRKRILHERDISISDSNSINFLLNRIEKGSEEEVIAVLNVVAVQPMNKERFYLKALKNGSHKIRLIALKNIQKDNCRGLISVLHKMLLTETDDQLISQLVRTVSSLDQQTDLTQYVNHENQDVANAAMMAWLSHEDQEMKKTAENHLMQLFESGHSGHAINALQIAGELKNERFSQHIGILMRHQDENIRMHAIHAAGKLADDHSISHLLTTFLQVDKEKAVLEALEIAGEPAIVHIRRVLFEIQISHAKCVNLLGLLGRIGGEEAGHLLRDCLHHLPAHSATILSTLYQLHYSCNGDRGALRKMLFENLAIGAEITFMLQFLQAHRDKYGLLIRALDWELVTIRTRCFWLFSFLYDGEKIRKAKAGIEANSKESIANSCELIEITVDKEYSYPFILMYEHTDLYYKCEQLKKWFSQPFISLSFLARHILSEKAYSFNDWTKSCFLYLFSERPDLLKPALIKPFMDSENPMLRETAVKSYGNQVH